MARGKRAPSRNARAVVLEEEARTPERDPIERILEKVEPARPPVEEETKSKSKLTAPSGMRSAHVVSMASGSLQIAFRGRREPVQAELAEGVEREVVAQAMKNRDAVLVEREDDGRMLVVGVIQTRMPRDVLIKAETIQIEAERELLLRSKSAAIRLREDGDVELVGGRILALSRGLFRLVGRVLRLN
jgi:hypothetical protein